jgi:WLM domain
MAFIVSYIVIDGTRIVDQRWIRSCVERLLVETTPAAKQSRTDYTCEHKMENLQQVHSLIEKISTTTTASASATVVLVMVVMVVVVMVVVLVIWKIARGSQRISPPQHHNSSDISSPEQLKELVAAAAWSRRSIQSPRRRRAAADDDDDDDDASKVVHKEKQMVTTGNGKNKTHNDDDDETATTIRQATLGDHVAWNEERSSRQQFGGFSIYGHPAAAAAAAAHPPAFSVDGCCSVVTPSRGHDDAGSSSSSSFTYHPSSANGFFDASHGGVSEICNLPGSDQARNLLQQLCHEFEPVLRSRGWSVGKVVEMCCCSSSSNVRPPNVAGYCVARGDGRSAHSIHIRLRPPGSCQQERFPSFYPYSSLVQTMAHELAHVKIQAHNDAFFELMTELEAERHQCLAASGGNGSDHFFMTISSGRRLGSGTGGASSDGVGPSPVIASRDLKRLVAMAAVKRQARNDSNKKTQ